MNIQTKNHSKLMSEFKLEILRYELVKRFACFGTRLSTRFALFCKVHFYHCCKFRLLDTCSKIESIFDRMTAWSNLYNVHCKEGKKNRFNAKIVKQLEQIEREIVEKLLC